MVLERQQRLGVSVVLLFGDHECFACFDELACVDIHKTYPLR